MASLSQPDRAAEPARAAVLASERSTRGRLLLTKWRRRLHVLLYALVALIVGAFIWRSICLIGLPAVGAPFDVATYQDYHVLPKEDAFIDYREAFGQLKSSTVAHDLPAVWKISRGGWGQAGPQVRAWVVENRGALETWRRGTVKPKAMPVASNDEKLEIQWQQTLKPLIDLTCLALLEGSRLEEAGDVAGSWGWYNASLRASRHVRMHGPSDYHAMGATIYDLTAQRLSTWAANPRVDAPTLRQALHDLEDVISMPAQNSDMIKADYLALLSALEHPDRWMTSSTEAGNFKADFPALFRTMVFLKREPERSRRVADLLFAHWLAHADDPPQSRPRMMETRVDGNHSYPNFPYYVAQGQKDAAHLLSNEKIYAWHQSTVYLKHLAIRFVWSLPACDSERTGQRIMLITLAEQLYQREHGKLPESADDLLSAGYLKELPEGYGKDRPAAPPAPTEK